MYVNVCALKIILLCVGGKVYYYTMSIFPSSSFCSVKSKPLNREPSSEGDTGDEIERYCSTSIIYTHVHVYCVCG